MKIDDKNADVVERLAHSLSSCSDHELEKSVMESIMRVAHEVKSISIVKGEAFTLKTLVEIGDEVLNHSDEIALMHNTFKDLVTVYAELP